MMNFPECAEALQRRGITVILYDPRSTGSSGGQPRNDIDPSLAVSDLSDALSHLMSLASVDSDKVGLLGFSFGGTAALSAAAVDPRCRFVVAVAPLTDLDFTSPAQRTRVLRKAAQDRESQLMGNAPFTIPMITERGDSAVGFGHGIDRERYGRLVREGRELAPGHVNRVTLMTYYRLAMWTPWPLWKRLGCEEAQARLRGVMFVIPRHDSMSYPDMQRKFYDEIGGGAEFLKTKLEVDDAGHEDVLGERHLPVVTNAIADFIEQVTQ